jgi:hypothetical protein
LKRKSAAAIYERRYDIEFDIRDLKVTMDDARISVPKAWIMVDEGVVHVDRGLQPRRSISPTSR